MYSLSDNLTELSTRKGPERILYPIGGAELGPGEFSGPLGHTPWGKPISQRRMDF